jgi:hypothetical protein
MQIWFHIQSYRVSASHDNHSFGQLEDPLAYPVSINIFAMMKKLEMLLGKELIWGTHLGLF